MKRLRLVFAFYLDASIHVALAVFALVFCTGYTLHILIDGHLAYFLLFGSISCYNFVKYGVEAEKYIRVANRYHKNIQFFSLICVALSMYHAFFLPVTTWLGIGVLVLLTGLYALPVMPGAKNLRNWGGFKIFLVALVWAGTTVTLPVLAIGGNCPGMFGSRPCSVFYWSWPYWCPLRFATFGTTTPNSERCRSDLGWRTPKSLERF